MNDYSFTRLDNIGSRSCQGFFASEHGPCGETHPVPMANGRTPTGFPKIAHYSMSLGVIGIFLLDILDNFTAK
jgi:hypothetical protein